MRRARRRSNRSTQAEKLLGELDPGRTYTYEYLCYRITNYRPGVAIRDLKFTGQRGGPRPAAVRRGPFRRGQRAGRRGRRAGADGRGVGPAVQRLDQDHFPLAAAGAGQPAVRVGRPQAGGFPGRVRWTGSWRGTRSGCAAGPQFSQLSEDERRQIIDRARRLAQAGGCPAEVTRRLARKTGRSPETIRYTLKQFDQEHPDLAIFPDNHGPLRLETKRKIYQQYHRGESVEALAKRFCRTRASIYRIIDEMRAQRILELPLDYIPNDAVRPGLRSEKREAEIARADAGQRGAAEEAAAAQRPAALPGQPVRGAAVDPGAGGAPVPQDELPEVQGRPSCASKLDPARPKSGLMDQIEQLYDEAVATKNQIIRANLRLVVSIAKRHVGPGGELLRAGQRRQHVADAGGGEVRLRPGQQVQHLRQLGDHEELRPHHPRRAPPPRPFPHQPGGDVQRDRGRPLATSSSRSRRRSQREAQVEKILDRLDEREQKIIISRFGLQRGQEPLTLKQVGAEMGVTKERIRQIEARALSKLRKAVEEEQIEFPD